MAIYLAALACVLGISIGQVLFKMTAQTFRQNGDLLDPVMLGWFFLSLFLYSIRPGFVLITLPGVEARPG